MIVLNLLQKRFSRSFAKIAKSGAERPTKYIYLLIFIFIGLFMQAYIHNYNIVYLALFFTFSFAFSGYFFGRENIKALHVELISYQRIFANRDSRYTLSLSSQKSNVLYDITVYSSEQSQHIKRIETSSKELVHFTHKYPARGQKSFNSVRCESAFTLPHQIFYRVFDLDKSFMVYAEPIGISLEEFLAKQKATQGEREDFEGLKSFELSDRVSEIYWPSLAKGTELMSKQFSYNANMQTLLFDFKSCAKSDEKRLSQLTLWVVECEKQSVNFKIMIASKILDSTKMESDEILSFLAQY